MDDAVRPSPTGVDRVQNPVGSTWVLALAVGVVAGRRRAVVVL